MDVYVLTEISWATKKQVCCICFSSLIINIFECYNSMASDIMPILVSEFILPCFSFISKEAPLQISLFDVLECYLSMPFV